MLPTVIRNFVQTNPNAPAVAAAVTVITLATTLVCGCWRSRKVTKSSDVPTEKEVHAAQVALKPPAAATTAPIKLSAATYTMTKNDGDKTVSVKFVTKVSVAEFLARESACSESTNVELTFTTDESHPDAEQKSKLLTLFPKLAHLTLNLPFGATKDWSWNAGNGVQVVRHVANQAA